MAEHRYGMRMRGFGPMCQPTDGLIDWTDSDKGKTGFYSVLTYNRELEQDEIYSYELTPIDAPEIPVYTVIFERLNHRKPSGTGNWVFRFNGPRGRECTVDMDGEFAECLTEAINAAREMGAYSIDVK